MLCGFAGTPEAIAAAKAGDIAELDRCELTWLNNWGPKPDVARFTNDERRELLAMEIGRRNGATIVMWGLVLPCGRCGRRVVADPRCRVCGGNGHVSDEWELICTDVDGNEVEVS